LNDLSFCTIERENNKCFLSCQQKTGQFLALYEIYKLYKSAAEIVSLRAVFVKGQDKRTTPPQNEEELESYKELFSMQTPSNRENSEK